MNLFDLLVSFMIIGVGAFGGGFTTIPLIEHEIVGVHGWITAAELSELIAIAQMTPGPIGLNAATYTGFRVAGFWGAIVAMIGYTLPSITFCATLIKLLAGLTGASWMNTLKKSVQPAVAGLIIAAVLMYGRAAVADIYAAILAVSAFIVLIASRDKVHPIAVILCGGVAGIFIYG
ncbi:MAG: chromate transporter [Chitinispirillales bacterium]|jgi:chromate transporter|nr:chromate transporter [Chitinispirillales bacterium]